MKNVLSRILILLLCLGLAIPLAACKKQPDPLNPAQSTEKTKEQTTEAPPPEDPDPVADYGNYEFTIYGREEDTSRSMMFPYEIGDNINEKGSFEAINSKIYARNAYIEKTYNIIIKGNYVTNNLGKMAADVESSINSGLVVYDLVLSSPYRMATLLNKGMLLNWNDSKTVDFTKPYWNKNLIDNTTIGEYSYVASSDMLLSAIDLSTCIIFNKSLTERYGIENLYDLVEEGKWTIDALYTLTKDIYSAQTDNDRRDEGDFYGFTTDLAAALRPYIYSSGMKLIDSTGEVPQVAINAGSVRFETLIDKLNTLFGSEGTFGCPQADDQFKLPYENFKNENSVMMAGTFSAVYSQFKDIKNLGILPYPLLEETSDPVYQSTINGEFSSMIIPSNNSDLDRTGVIASMMAKYSDEAVYQYYDVMLKGRYADEPEDAKMITLIKNGSTMDLSQIYTGDTSAKRPLNNIMRWIFEEQTHNFTSYWTAYGGVSESYFADLFEEMTKPKTSQ